MRMFISWSGDIGKSLGKVLNRLIPKYFRVDTFFSEDDLGKGENWEEGVAKALRECEFSLVIITPQSLNSHWVTYEAGALWSRYEATHVCPILVGVEAESCPRPLRKFQLTICSEEQMEQTRAEFERLILTMAASVAVPTLTKDGVLAVFNAVWPELQKAVNVAYRRIREDQQRSIVDRRHDLLQNEIDGLEEQLGMLSTSVGSPAYFMDAGYSIIYANLAASLVFGLRASRDSVVPASTFFSSVKNRVRDWGAIEARFNSRFRDSRVPPQWDFERIEYRHDDYGWMALEKIGLPVRLGRSGNEPGSASPIGWVVTFNVSSIENADLYYEKLRTQVQGMVFGMRSQGQKAFGRREHSASRRRRSADPREARRLASGQ